METNVSTDYIMFNYLFWVWTGSKTHFLNDVFIGSLILEHNHRSVQFSLIKFSERVQMRNKKALEIRLIKLRKQKVWANWNWFWKNLLKRKRSKLWVKNEWLGIQCLLWFDRSCCFSNPQAQHLSSGWCESSHL